MFLASRDKVARIASHSERLVDIDTFPYSLRNFRSRFSLSTATNSLLLEFLFENSPTFRVAPFLERKYTIVNGSEHSIKLYGLLLTAYTGKWAMA